jgi:hypothetical protein
MKIKIALLFVFSLISSIAKAQSLPPVGSLGYLIKSCEYAREFTKPDSSDDPSKIMHGIYCMAYLNGVFDTIRVFHDTSVDWKKELHPIVNDFCPPEKGITIESLIDTFLNYTKNNDIKLIDPARSYVITALSKSLPCISSNKKQ